MTRIATIARRIRQERGSTSVEYSTVMLFIAIVLDFALASGLAGLLDDIPGAITSALP
jgi:Flp pilus assembly pilin Flp